MNKTPQLSSTGYVDVPANVAKIHASAELPRKDDPESVYHVLTLCERMGNRAEDDVGLINEFGIGLTILPPKGYYFEMYGLPTLLKHGYSFEGPYIIDRTTGPLVISLLKFKDGDDLELPFEAVMLVPKPHFPIHIVSTQKSQIREEEFSLPQYSANQPREQKPQKVSKKKNAYY